MLKNQLKDNQEDDLVSFPGVLDLANPAPLMVPRLAEESLILSVVSLSG